MAAAAACSGVWCLWSAKLVALHQRGRGQVGACGTLARAYCRIESSAKGGRVHESSASGAGFGAGAVVGAGGGAGARPLYGTGNGGPLGRAARAGFKIPTPSCEGFIRAPLSSGAGPETRRIVARAGDGQGDENDSMTTTTTNKSSVAEELVEFLNGACTPFHAVHEAKVRLKEAGYEQLSEREAWPLKPGGKYYFTRNHSTIVAFAIGMRYEAGNGFYAIGCHTDSPCPKLKPITKISKAGFLEVGVQMYGGGLWYTWFDRDLTVAGRVFVQRGEKISHELVRVPRPILKVPSLAIHLNRTVNEGFKFNLQTNFVPILATALKDEANKLVTVPDSSSESAAGSNGTVKQSVADGAHHPLLLQVLAEELNCQPKDILNFELDVIDTQPSVIGGALKEFIFSGRLDNLCSSFCALKALIDATSGNSLDEEVGVRMISLFDHEEIGSASAQGAGSPVFIDTLQRVTTQFSAADSKGVFEQGVQKSFLVSADMAHSLHPNYMDKHDDNHQPQIHKGLVIKHNCNQKYATNSATALIFREIGARHNIPTQEFVVRNDMACGSTIGPIVASGTGIRTVDVGAPQLSMHSIREMCGTDDVGYTYQHFKAFFEEFSELDGKISADV
ncbi:aspartyl aminopeptidase [Marchantia polymorpha subsp. ruderalis]|uniref:Aspartyl aminopeptidase n=2 Tax=Marchantia polymorpha TaxID=3197 RepID=A0A176VZ18_MARPO|nr:hypothetical protein AXG93_1712s1670 [Marchantia polymorpha subsp. ruderalis]PTQ49738.1 hypothetical protein MARPO_0002s0201 [Marchantia polymorpha]BBN00146.1 hypothetical protein Mp_1g26770 [Marchantia polymorpha subsp. ruderalis]|eukprot:PTQ49738.1 hypothetical protein MARPO_0002s0201 [Marchantia polymorpha]